MDTEKDGSPGRRRRRAGAGVMLYFAGVLFPAPTQGLYLLGDRDEALDE